MERIKNGWELTKRSFSVIKSDNEILLYPILSAVIIFLIILGFLAVLFFLIPAYTINQDITKIILIILLFVYLVLLQFITIFFEAAIITSATVRFNGKNPSFSDGFSKATKRIGRLFTWSVITAAVSIFLNALKNLGRRKGQGVNKRAAIAGGISSFIFGVAWGILTFFVLPIILFENLGVFSSIKQSWNLFKRTWGENVTAQFSIGMIFFLFSLFGFIPFILAILLFDISVILGVGLIFLSLFYWGFLMILSRSVNGILKAGLYHYATTGELPEPYEGIENKFFKLKSK